MNMLSSNAPAVQRLRLVHWATVIGGMTLAFAAGLLTANSFSFTTERPHTAVNAVVNQPATVSAPTTLEIVPSPVIEANPQFFFGTGDASGGYWADRPKP